MPARTEPFAQLVRARFDPAPHDLSAMKRTVRKHLTHVLELNITILGLPVGSETDLPSMLAKSIASAREPPPRALTGRPG
jgi:hypothetical protein